MTTQPPDPAAADQTDAETTPTTEPVPPETFKTRRPGWKRDKLPPVSAEGETGDGSDAGEGYPALSELPPEPKSSRTGGSRTSSRAELRKALKVGVLGTTAIAHEMLARDAYDQLVEIYLMDEDEADEIAKPASAIMARRMKDAPIHPDVSDGIALAIAAAGYAWRQLQKVLEARRMRAAAAVIGDGLQPDLTHDQGTTYEDPGPVPA